MSDLLTPSREIVSLDQAREEKEQAKKRPPGSHMKDLVSREEMMMAVAKASLTLGQKMYDQVSGELAENFEEQEHRLIGLIERRFAALEREREATTLRGRWRALVRWVKVQGGWVPPLTGPALWQDQATHEAAAKEFAAANAPAPGSKEALRAELRRRIETCADGADVEVPDGLTKEEAIEVANLYDQEVRDAVASVKADVEAGK